VAAEAAEAAALAPRHLQRAVRVREAALARVRQQLVAAEEAALARRHLQRAVRARAQAALVRLRQQLVAAEASGHRGSA